MQINSVVGLDVDVRGGRGRAVNIQDVVVNSDNWPAVIVESDLFAIEANKDVGVLLQVSHAVDLRRAGADAEKKLALVRVEGHRPGLAGVGACGSQASLDFRRQAVSVVLALVQENAVLSIVGVDLSKIEGAVLAVDGGPCMGAVELIHHDLVGFLDRDPAGQLVAEGGIRPP